MGSATRQGRLWGNRARDFAERLEQLTLPLTGAVLDAARVAPGTRVLDAGCGAGLLLLLARLRGAHPSGVDVSPALLDVARRRLPGVDLREGDLESLPFADAAFDAVTAVNSIFYAADLSSAMRELSRVARQGGRVVVTAWGPPERCELLRDLLPAIGPLMPPPPPGAKPGHPGALSAPGALAGLLEAAELKVLDEGEVECPFVFPDAEGSWITNASAGVNQMAIEHSGEGAVRAAIAAADLAHTRTDGSVRYDNVFLWAAGERR